MTPNETIEQIMIQFGFAIKLLSYIEQEKLNKDEFDLNTTIILRRKNLHFKDNTFNTYDDIIIAAENNYLITFAALAIAIEDCLEDAGFKHNSSDTSGKGKLRNIIYMVRCAHAHNIMNPIWKINKNYQKVLNCKAGSYTKKIDLIKINGKDFNIEDIGGIDFYLEIINELKKWI